MVKKRRDSTAVSTNSTILSFTWLSILTFINFFILIDCCSAGNGCVFLVPGSTQKICQLTGNFDADKNFYQYTVNRTLDQFGIKGTDLGSSFEHNGRIYFLFGDTITNQYYQYDLDCIAYTTDTSPDNCVELAFNKSGTRFKPPYVYPPIPQGGLCVPTEGLSYRRNMYVYFITRDVQGNYFARTVLAKSTNDGYTFTQLYEMSSHNNAQSPQPKKFINVSAEIVNAADIPGLPQQTGQLVLIWGSGEYQASNPYLAYIPLEYIENKSYLRYFMGTDESNTPRWSEYESDAVPLFDHPQIGEFSVTWNPYVKKWLMLYNTSAGIIFRVADYPWGPWSDPSILFNPFIDNGYCNFIHRGDCLTGLCYYEKTCDTNKDNFQRTQCGNITYAGCRWGGTYGPYIISKFTTGVVDQETTIYFTLSTWNPYQVMLMKSTLQMFGDADRDGICDVNDNCPYHYNPNQEDSYPPGGGNGCGDACECEGDLDADGDVDGDDVFAFKKGSFDLDGDGDVDGDDAMIFKKDYRRLDCPTNCN